MRSHRFRAIRHYAPWFGSAGEVADYLCQNKQRLLGGTRDWNKTWYGKLALREFAVGQTEWVAAGRAIVIVDGKEIAA